MADEKRNDGAPRGRRDGDAKGQGGYQRGGANKGGGYRRDDRGPKRDGERREGGYRGGNRSGGRDGYKRDDSRGPRRDGEFRSSRDGYNRDDRGPKGGYKRDGERRDFKRGDSRGPRRDGDARGGQGGYRGRDDRGPKREFSRDGERRDFKKRDGGFKRDGDHGPRRDDRDFKRDDRRDGDRGPKRDFKRDGNRGPKRDFDRRDDRGPKRDGDFKRREGDSRPKRDDRAPKREKPLKRIAFRKSKATPARLAAYEVVRAVRERNAFAQSLIDTIIDGSRLSFEDRAFATRLALGVVSARGTLDEIIDRALDDPGDVFRETRDALQISTYEIIFLGKEAHAAVDQGVEMVKAFAPAAANLANAALHRVVRLRYEFPFGDPATDLEALARTQAFPAWLAKKLMEDVGPEAAIDFMRASNEPAPLFVAVNAIRTDDEAALKAFARAEEEARAMSIGDAPVPGCLRVAESRALLVPGVKRQIAQGKILVSDAASQMVAASVLPEAKPSSVLEVGAGRATKTILLQSNAQRAWGSQVEEYVTLDNHPFKTELLAERAEAYGVQVAETLTGDACCLDDVMPGREFGFVFIDAPCSGLGTLRRHPEIRWRIQPGDFAGFAATQLAMLRSAARHVEMGGTLAYATCTVTREENGGVVKAFLESAEGKAFKLVPIAGRSHLAMRVAPGSSDAHFAVRFERVGDIVDAPEPEPSPVAEEAEGAVVAEAEAAKADAAAAPEPAGPQAGDEAEMAEIEAAMAEDAPAAEPAAAPADVPEPEASR